MGISADLANRVSVTIANGSTTVVPIVAQGPAGADGSNVLPTDTAIAAALADTGSDTYATAAAFVRSTAIVPDTVAPAATGIAGTDTANLQAAIDATPTYGTLHIPRGIYHLNDALSVTDHISISGAGVFIVGGNYEDDPGSDPYLQGTVLYQAGAGKNGITISGVRLHVDLARFGISFATAIRGTNTGHGIACVPPTISGGRDGGPMHSRWDKITVSGHDGDHYGFRIVNPLYVTLIDLHSFGGGILYIGSESTGVNYGNMLVMHPVGIVNYTGTADAYHLDAPVASGLGLLNLIEFHRPQANIEGASSAQYLWNDNGTPIDIKITAPDLENDTGGVACPIVFGKQTYVDLAGGTFIATPAAYQDQPAYNFFTQPTISVGGNLGSGGTVSFSGHQTDLTGQVVINVVSPGGGAGSHLADVMFGTPILLVVAIELVACFVPPPVGFYVGEIYADGSGHATGFKINSVGVPASSTTYQLWYVVKRS